MKRNSFSPLGKRKDGFGFELCTNTQTTPVSNYKTKCDSINISSIRLLVTFVVSVSLLSCSVAKRIQCDRKQLLL